MPEKQFNSIYEGVGNIVFRTSSIHFLAAQIISYYYLGNDNPYRLSFTNDVLTNEYTNLSFITNALKRVLINLEFDRKYVEEKIENRMLRVGKLRNRFAHEVFLYNQDTHWLLNRKKIPWRGEGLKFEDEFKIFDDLHKEIIDELNKIIKDKGIKITESIPNGYWPPKEAASKSHNSQQQSPLIKNGSDS